MRIHGTGSVGRTLALATLLLAGLALPAFAQVAPSAVTVRVVAEDSPVLDAQVSTGGTGALTDARGEAVLRLMAGEHAIRITKPGLRTVELRVQVQAGRDTSVVAVLAVEAIETEAIIVSSTRSERRIEEAPVRVEVLSREEVEEKLLMTPGDISMLLNETAGLRVQSTAPALGGASVRIQGLRGRYTQILSDGLPLYGGQTGALGPLQIPPMDLGQVEVIKGAASALYGASALGGVVNLLSRRPGEEADRELLLNQSTLGGTDAILWSSAPLGKYWSYTLLASGHRQTTADPDSDGWADLPAYRRAIARPRLFWNNGRGASAFVTAGAMLESREGGTIDNNTTPAGSPFEETLDTKRGDLGAVARLLLGESLLLSMRGSAVLQQHEHGFDTVLERDAHTTMFAEATLAGAKRNHSWVVGLALQRENYNADDVTGFDYTHTVPGIFVQDEYAPASWLTLSASARFDHHSEYGSFVNPRLSLLLRPGAEWTMRASAGTGYFAPTPWVEEVESIGLHQLTPLQELDAERARSASLDIGRTFDALELNATVFAAEIENAVQTRPDPSDATRLELFNAADDVRTYGTELLARYHVEGLHVTATHVYMHSTEPDPLTGVRRTVPLTPKHTSGLVAAWEQEERGRVGVEFYYTGRQELENNPYRQDSSPYVIVGFLVERRFGRARLFLNAENLFDTRQTRHDSLLLPVRSAEGRWTTDVWAPLEGRSFNGGVRWQF